MKLSLTNEMKELLKNCHERELNDDDPCSDKIVLLYPELLLNGIVEMKPHRFKNNERKIAYFLTDKGKALLKDLDT